MGEVFGRSITINMPAGTDMLVVFADLHQHVPVWMGMPHQLYAHTAVDLLDKHGAESLTIVPYRNADKVTLTRKHIDAMEGRDG